MLAAAAAFVIGATVGMGLLAAVLIVAALLALRHASGIATAMLGLKHWPVLAVPAAFGAAAAWWALRRMRQVSR